MTKDGLDKWIGKVYGARSSDEVKGHYDEWAVEYDRDLMATGYSYPPVATGLCVRYVPDTDARILDAGCGTGLIGASMARLGYHDIDGLDLSRGMLDSARAKGCYKNLHHLPLGAEIDLPPDSYDLVLCTGVLTLGHAPPDSLQGMVTVTRPGGHLVMSISEPALQQGFADKIDDLAAAGAWTLLERTERFLAMPFSREEGDLAVRFYAFRKPS